MNIYIDTSAYVKEYHDESGSELVHSVFESAKNGDDKRDHKHNRPAFHAPRIK